MITNKSSLIWFDRSGPDPILKTVVLTIIVYGDFHIHHIYYYLSEDNVFCVKHKWVKYIKKNDDWCLMHRENHFPVHEKRVIDQRDRVPFRWSLKLLLSLFSSVNLFSVFNIFFLLLLYILTNQLCISICINNFFNNWWPIVYEHLRKWI